nr:MAG TPA: hypothetical protein [Microviridae sp.]
MGHSRITQFLHKPKRPVPTALFQTFYTLTTGHSVDTTLLILDIPRNKTTHNRIPPRLTRTRRTRREPRLRPRRLLRPLRIAKNVISY